MKSKISIFILAIVISIQSIHAWSGLTAEIGDVINITKWNELVSDKLSRVNLKAGTNITLTSSGSDIIINSTASGSVNPYIGNTAGFSIQPSTTNTFILTGRNFTPSTTLTTPAGTISAISISSPTDLTFDLASISTLGTYNLVLANGGATNSVWTGNGVNFINISTIQYSCKGVYDSGGSVGNGYYVLGIPGGGGTTYQAYCDMTTDGGGWTRIVRTNSNDHEWGQKTDSYTYSAYNADLGIYDSYRYVDDFSKTMLKHIDSSTYASYNLASTSTDTIYEHMTYCKGQPRMHSNDTAWDGVRLKGMTSHYSGTKVAGTMLNVGFFFMCGVNEESDNDQSYLTFARSSGQSGNGYADSWRGTNQKYTTWSLLNNDYYTTTNNHIGNGQSQAGAGKKQDGTTGYYEVYIK